MKVLPVCFSFKSQHDSIHNSEFFYTREVKEYKHPEKHLLIYNVATALCAVGAVAIALFNVGRTHKSTLFK